MSPYHLVEDKQIEVDADNARRQMVDHLVASGAITSERIEAAFRVVDRHSFLPNTSMRDAYEDRPVVLRVNDRGVLTSTASQPSMIAEMLEQLDVEVGDRVLEIGTGSGYEAALLSELVGESGSVVTVEIDKGLADAARSCLWRCGYRRVEVVTADGRLGYQPHAPYDEIIVTAGAQEIPRAWRDQLVNHGRLVVPLVDRWGSGFSVALEKTKEQWITLNQLPCSFVLMQDG